MSKISELSDGGSLVSSDYLIAVRSGGNVKVRMDQINVDQVDLGDNEFIRLGNSQDLTMVHTSTQSIINQAGIGDLLLQKAGTTKASITANGLEFPDNSKAIFGAGSDLSLYHTGGNSYVLSNTGSLILRSDSFRVLNTANSEQILHGDANGAVTAYYDNAVKLATTATGIDVTGSVTADGLTVGDTSDSQTIIQMLANSTNGANTIHFGDAASGAASYVGYINYAHGSNSMQFSANGAERLRIDANGNVGIGCSPAYPLEVVGAAGDSLTITARSGDATAANNAGGGFRNIGSATATSRSAQMWLDADGANLSGGDYFYMEKKGNSGDLILSQYSNASIIFRTNAEQERLRIDASGDVSIGTTGGGARLRVSGAANTSASIVQVGTVGYPAIDFRNPSFLQVGYILVTSNAVSLVSVSDQRLKENIADADDAGSKIDAIQVRKFDWKSDGSHQDYGMVAQELLEVAPEAVSAQEDPEKMMGVDYSKLVPMMLKEIQSLRARVAQLES